MKLLTATATLLSLVEAGKRATKHQLNTAASEISAIGSKAFAGVPSLQSGMDNLAKSLASSNIDEDMLRDVQSGAISLDALMGYGCWCFFGNIDSALGRGPPIDGYDATCQKLALCYRCIFVDAANEGDDDCDPFNTAFEATIDIGGLLGGGGIGNATISCTQENVADCSWRTCSCAMTMITSFFNLSFDSQNTYDDNMKHANGFDYQLECPQQGKSLDRQCCGFYPARRTYDRGEARECCHERTIYNPLRHICCPDGSHLGLGHSC